nr:threonine/homoserine exporter RhtA [Thermosporothrix sp. COM3]
MLRRGRERRKPSARLVGYLMVVTASLLFGLNGNISKPLFAGGVSAITLTAFRTLIGGLCLLIVLLPGLRSSLRVPVRSLGWLLAFGVTLALVTFTYFMAISRLPIAIALTIQFSAAAWMTVGEAIWRRKLPTVHVLLALVCAFGGLLLLTGIWRADFRSLDPWGLFFALLSLLFFIAYLLLGERVSRDMSPLAATAYGSLIAALIWFCVQPPWTIPATTWSGMNGLLILAVGILGMALPFALHLGALQRVNPTRVGIVANLEMVAGGLIAFLWLGETLDLWQSVGCVLVLAGLIILQYERESPLEGLTR